MRKTISFGKIAYTSKRKVNEVDVEVEYDVTDGVDRFSVCGNVWNSKHTDIVAGGQCLDMLNDYLHNNPLFKKIHGLWKRNHLCDMDASANDEQRNAVNEYLKENRYDYGNVCEYLKGKGLFEVDVNGKKCKYGHEWYHRGISDEDRFEIERLFDNP